MYILNEQGNVYGTNHFDLHSENEKNLKMSSKEKKGSLICLHIRGSTGTIQKGGILS